MEMVSAQFGKTSGVQLRHFIVSFDQTEVNDPMIVNEIARRFVEFFSNEYQVVYAVHEDKQYLHIHIVINSVSYVDGHRYYGTRAEFKAMQKYMQAILRNYNIYRLEYVSLKQK